MASGVMTSGRYSNNYDKRFNEIFMDSYNERTPEYTMLAKVSNCSEQFIKKGDMAALGTMTYVSEGSGGPLEAFTQGNNKTVYFKEYKMNVQITEVAREDDLTGMMNMIPKKMGSSAQYSVEYLFWNLINTGFTSTTVLGLDGYCLFSASHPYIDYGSGAQSNTSTNSFSYSALQTMSDAVENTLNEKGLPVIYKLNKLIIPKELKWLAEEILGTGANMKPNTAENTINTVQALEDYSYMVCHYLSSTTAWFGFSNDHDIQWIWRRAIKTDSWNDKNTGNDVHQVKMRCAPTFFAWRGAYGSTGA
jgi:hypothetical protein